MKTRMLSMPTARVGGLEWFDMASKGECAGLAD